MRNKKRVAETLVEEGLITEFQLQGALQRQLIMGGKVGTNLLELSYITEEKLAAVLGKMFSIEPAPMESFRGIPQETIKLIHGELAVRHRVIPLKKEDKTLYLAMEDPENLAIIDEIRFITGCRIVPLLAVETRIFIELEHYYHHRRPLRYIKVGKGLAEWTEESGPVNPLSTERSAEPEAVAATVSDGWLGVADEDYHENNFRLDGSLRPMEIKPAVPNHVTFDDTVMLLSKIESRDEAIQIVLDYISQGMENVIFLVSSVAEAKVWNAKCKEIEYDSIRDLKVNFGGPSVFLTVKNEEKAYCGEISAFPFDSDFLEKIRRQRPLNVYVAPIFIKTRMVAMLYLDNNGKDITRDNMDEVDAMMEKLSIAFEILLLKKKTQGLQKKGRSL